MKTIRIEIQGDVQGVFFRASAKRIADGLGVRGWIQNREDGSVEAVACGEEGLIREFLDYCRRGPSGARVTDVKIEETNACEESGFSVR